MKALIRRVHDAGGSAMILARGDAMGGAVLAIAQVPGAPPRALERGLGDGGLIAAGPAEADDSALLDYWRRRRARDPDLWVVEVIVADAERFVAETIAAD
ncbi:DUF1491 family protein [Sphingomonas donggukensis]|uniref:DUF1491 family protein n=1 Tax=Sphingomonas donggukensis TaxID=2949093 RepID=A0ABY4TTU0_9SPHN|nr:DUF1491 family protein [Sphingomonas donggukensis]URW75265.1 DUF1491 family protein [Sphingomonas donggukensis]